MVSTMVMAAINYKATKVYKLAYEQAMEIFKISKGFPPEEKYSLTDQVRRSSRSVCTNIAEAYRKKDTQLILFYRSPIVMLKIRKQVCG